MGLTVCKEKRERLREREGQDKMWNDGIGERKGREGQTLRIGSADSPYARFRQSVQHVPLAPSWSPHGHPWTCAVFPRALWSSNGQFVQLQEIPVEPQSLTIISAPLQNCLFFILNFYRVVASHVRFPSPLSKLHHELRRVSLLTHSSLLFVHKTPKMCISRCVRVLDLAHCTSCPFLP